MRHVIDEVKEIGRTCALLRKLSSINGANVSGELLDRVMYSFEALPPLGKGVLVAPILWSRQDADDASNVQEIGKEHGLQRRGAN